MNVADGVISIIIYIWQHTILFVLPTNFPGISLNDFIAGLQIIKTYVLTPIYVINLIFPIDILFILILAYLALQFVLLGARLGIAGFNALRGSGVKI